MYIKILNFSYKKMVKLSVIEKLQKSMKEIVPNDDFYVLIDVVRNLTSCIMFIIIF